MAKDWLENEAGRTSGRLLKRRSAAEPSCDLNAYMKLPVCHGFWVNLLLDWDGPFFVLKGGISMRHVLTAYPATVVEASIRDAERGHHIGDSPHLVEITSPEAQAIPVIAPGRELLYKSWSMKRLFSSDYGNIRGKSRNSL